MISEEYKAEQQRMHQEIPEYGVASVNFAPVVSKIVNELEIKDILDFGAGKGRLADALDINHPATMTLYDPGIPGIDEPPSKQHEMVCCIDVLEHIEPQHLEAVLDKLAEVTGRVGFFTVHTGPAKKVLSDGRNAHLIQEGSHWWLPKILERFDLHSFNAVPNGFMVIVWRLQRT